MLARTREARNGGGDTAQAAHWLPPRCCRWVNLPSGNHELLVAACSIHGRDQRVGLELGPPRRLLDGCEVLWNSRTMLYLDAIVRPHG